MENVSQATVGVGSSYWVSSFPEPSPVGGRGEDLPPALHQLCWRGWAQCHSNSTHYPRNIRRHGAHHGRNYTLHHKLSEQDPGTTVHPLSGPTPLSSSAVSRKSVGP